MRKSRSLLLGSSPNSDRLLEDGLHLPRPKAVSASGKIEPQESKLVTVSEAARFLHVQPGTVYKMLSRGGIPGAYPVTGVHCDNTMGGFLFWQHAESKCVDRQGKPIASPSMKTGLGLTQ
jgi:excisionase family DNA binding protein